MKITGHKNILLLFLENLMEHTLQRYTAHYGPDGNTSMKSNMGYRHRNVSAKDKSRLSHFDRCKEET